jgi:hypothetical protein
MHIIEIVGADAMAEKTAKRKIIIEKEKEIQKKQAFYDLIEKIKQEIHIAAENGYGHCEVTIMTGEYWSITYEKDMKKIVEMFQVAGYSIRWNEYSTSWQYRSGKQCYFYIEW